MNKNHLEIMQFVQHVASIKPSVWFEYTSFSHIYTVNTTILKTCLELVCSMDLWHAANSINQLFQNVLQYWIWPPGFGLILLLSDPSMVFDRLDHAIPLKYWVWVSCSVLNCLFFKSYLPNRSFTFSHRNYLRLQLQSMFFLLIFFACYFAFIW